ncbi:MULTISPECIES: hypothetical protein [unclassified Roseateles]|uniref:hypothetical protein n=1 Tax=Pelomonas sp. Root1237 TaxID=1736434 RepID=UPI0006F41480|nr:hypothetical protein [Pelomonas sp. Root1237]KQV89185.1 hypothetical protein ASC91_11175 [Pelomonas sp. Root1237]
MPHPLARPWPLLLLALAATCGAASPLPTPGHYRIDGEATMRSGSGPLLVERVERWDGSNGNRFITTRADGRSHQQTYAGTEPVTWCVPAASVPPNQLPDRCKTRWWPAQGGTLLQAECQAGRLQEQWKQLDAKTWERQMRLTLAPGGGGSDPAAALAMVERGLSPAEAAKARAAIAALPSAQGRAAAMAPVYEKIEATIRNGKPEEAAAARQQLAALQAAQGGSGVTWTTTLTERWTLTGDHCKPGS